MIRGPVVNQRAARLKEAIRRRLSWTKRLPGYPLDVNCFNKRSFRRLLERADFREVEWIDEAAGFGNLLAQRISTKPAEGSSADRR